MGHITHSFGAHSSSIAYWIQSQYRSLPHTCTQADINTVSSCFGVVNIIVSHNMPIRTSSGSMLSHRYFRAYKLFHGVVVSCVCLSWLLIFSLALYSIFCGAVHVYMHLRYRSRQLCSRDSDSAPDCRGTFAAIFLALVWHQQSVCSIQCAICHQLWKSGMRWVSLLHTNTGDSVQYAIV